MTRYLLDTNHAGALLRDDPRVRARIAVLATAEFNICMPCIGELWFMVYNSVRQTENRAKLLSLLSRVQVVTYGMPEAEEFGKVRVELRRQGTPVPQIDAQIAAIARVGGFILATADAHFAHVSGLTVENWLTTP
jgi:tRNA(fMet)-specific endonuclease VapC